jgi:hypothetical protein
MTVAASCVLTWALENTSLGCVATEFGHIVRSSAWQVQGTTIIRHGAREIYEEALLGSGSP